MAKKTENRNVYGVLDCPHCKSQFRWPTQPTHHQHSSAIVCDDCGFVEPIAADRKLAASLRPRSNSVTRVKKPKKRRLR